MIKITTAVIFIICLNLASWMVVNGDLISNPGFTSTLNVTAKTQELNSTLPSTESLNPANQITLIVGYIWTGFGIFLNLVSWVAFGFPMLMTTFGVPTLVALPLGLLWTFIFGVFLVEFLSGRSTSGGY